MQYREHYIEAKGIEKIKQWALRHNVSFSDIHDDFSTGIDIILDGKSYDLKVTRSSWLSLVKKYKDGWYCPLEMHQEVPYLILRGNEGFILDKKELFKFCNQQSMSSGIQLGIYVLDGNLNITFNAARFMQKPNFDFTN